MPSVDRKGGNIPTPLFQSSKTFLGSQLSLSSRDTTQSSLRIRRVSDDRNVLAEYFFLDLLPGKSYTCARLSLHIGVADVEIID